ncbi:hypothetical protein [Natronosalvus halobius]|nr:hypothetical protein [Natronosalvus halobius]
MIEVTGTVDVGRDLTVVNANASVSATATAVVEAGHDRPTS